jgi:hypothetical protein
MHTPKIEINVGLSSKTLGEINPKEVLNSLTGRGFILEAFRVVPSDCKDGSEDCLTIRTQAPEDWQFHIAEISALYGQECIGCALFLGPEPYDEFDPTLWKTPTIQASK